MQSIEAATALLENYNASPATIRNRPVFFQYSSRGEIVANPKFAGAAGYSGQGASVAETPSSILLVTVLNCRMPVSIENLHEIFRPHGQVLKIVIFLKNDVFKALVQLGSVESAVSARMFLEGKDMFQGCCHLTLRYSNLPSITIKENGPRSRDFTVPDQNYGQQAVFGTLPTSAQVGVLPQSYAFGAHGAAAAGMPQSVAGFAPEKGAVLLVNNLPDDASFTPDMIFTLFGVYGDVARVKIMFNKRSSAFVQYFQAAHAQTARQMLEHLPLMGKELHVTSSKHPEILIPREREEGAELTKDFSTSPAHRYRGRNIRNSQHMHAPSPVLHVANLPDGFTEADLKKLFVDSQGNAPMVQFFALNRRMAYVKMASIAEAVLALIRNHNTKIGSSYMRVSFSPRDPSQVVETETPEAAPAQQSPAANQQQQQ